ncbi:adhesin, partial [Bacillus cereus]|uniref:LPXTG cell wall anchor domain-containing protein n=1 Tax=Bacillus cereus TaxID=1396 RepID=UPI000C016C1D
EVTEKPGILVTPEEEHSEVPNKPEVEEKPEVPSKPEVKEQPGVPSKPGEKEQPEVQNKQDVQDKSEVPSSKENNKQSKVLPQTGGASTESTSIIAGMFALILGSRLFRRKKN